MISRDLDQPDLIRLECRQVFEASCFLAMYLVNVKEGDPTRTHLLTRNLHRDKPNVAITSVIANVVCIRSFSKVAATEKKRARNTRYIPTSSQSVTPPWQCAPKTIPTVHRNANRILWSLNKEKGLVQVIYYLWVEFNDKLSLVDDTRHRWSEPSTTTRCVDLGRPSELNFAALRKSFTWINIPKIQMQQQQLRD